MPTVNDLMSRYEHEHKNPWNKLLHAIGIPVILAGLVLIFVRFPVGLTLFVLGWVLLLSGHRIEGNNPAFFQGPVYFLVGPIWVAKEIKELFVRNPRGVSPSRQ